MIADQRSFEPPGLFPNLAWEEGRPGRLCRTGASVGDREWISPGVGTAGDRIRGVCSFFVRQEW